MKLSKTLSAALLAATLVPLTLTAQSEDFTRKGKQGGGNHAQRIAKMQQMDANRDGIITREEAENSGNPERVQRIFDHLDADGDGQITAMERRAARERFSGGDGRKGPSGKKGGGSGCSSCGI